jgi:hypothetical protein
LVADADPAAVRKADSMATFTVRSRTGIRQITADRYQADGSWLVFKIRGHSDLRISADGVQSVTGTDPPGKLAPALRRSGVVVMTGMAGFCFSVGLVDVLSAGKAGADLRAAPCGAVLARP